MARFFIDHKDGRVTEVGLAELCYGPLALVQEELNAVMRLTDGEYALTDEGAIYRDDDGSTIAGMVRDPRTQMFATYIDAE